MRAQLLAFPNFSLIKYLSLHPATKLCQVSQAPRPPQLRRYEWHGQIKAVCQREHNYIRSLIHPGSPICTSSAQHAQPMLKNNSLPGTHQPCCTHLVSPSTAESPECTLSRANLRTDFFCYRMGCHRDNVLGHFPPFCRKQETATHPCLSNIISCTNIF